MKKILCLVLLSLAPLLTAQQVTIERITGKVQISQVAGQWNTVTDGDIIPSGATVSTGFRSSARLNTGDARIEIAQLTRLTLEELIAKEDSVSTTLFLNGGRINAEVSRERVRHDFTVRSPIATASVRGTGFQFDGRVLEVAHGAVMIIGGGNSVLALKGDRIGTDRSGNPDSRLLALAEQAGVEAVLKLFNEEDFPEGMNIGDLEDSLRNALLKRSQSDQVYLGILVQ